MQQQAIGGDQQHLEEHEQVEQVAGEKGAGQPNNCIWNSTWKCRPLRSAPSGVDKRRTVPAAW
jgi:hypothetical protein